MRLRNLFQYFLHSSLEYLDPLQLERGRYMVGEFENRGGERRMTDKMLGEMKAEGEKYSRKHETRFEQFGDTKQISQIERTERINLVHYVTQN